MSVEEIRNQLTMMKGNKACGPDMIPIEVWKKMGEEGIVFLKKELKRNINIWPTILMEVERSNTTVEMKRFHTGV